MYPNHENRILIIAPKGSFGGAYDRSQISESLAGNGNRLIFAEQQNHYLCSLHLEVIIDILNRVANFQIGAILSGIAYDLSKGLIRSIGPCFGGYSIKLNAFGKSRHVITPSDDEKEAARLILEALTEIYDEMQCSEFKPSIESNDEGHPIGSPKGSVPTNKH